MKEGSKRWCGEQQGKKEKCRDSVYLESCEGECDAQGRAVALKRRDMRILYAVHE